jgi:metallo-beta-lactamase family protein
VTARLVDAGHILGSAGIILELEERGRRVRLMFSGDIGRRGLPIIRDPILPHDVDVLIMECTYGDKPHDSPDQAYDEMKAVVWRTFERGGKLIIPAFALGRTQTLIYYLHQMIDRKEIPDVPVFVDSPLAINITDVFEQHPELFDEEATNFFRAHPRGEPFGFDKLSFTRSVEESKAINERKGPLVIVSASGMAENGRILHHLRNNIGDARNTILITSWMAPHTLGRRLVERQPRVKIFGEEHELRAEVVAVDGLSAHAGQQALLAYARAVRGRARQIFLVHGEPGPAAALKDKLGDMGSTAIHYPQPGQSFEL